MLNTVAGIGTAVIVWGGGMSVLGGQVSPGDWFLFVESISLFWFPLTGIASFWSQFQLGLSASERVFALIDAEPRVVASTKPVEPARLAELQADGYERQGKILARTGAYELIIEALEAHSDVEKIVQHLKTRLYGAASADGAFALQQAMQALEVMVSDYWVFASVNKKKPVLNMHTPKEGQYIYTTALGAPKSEGAGAA